MIRTLNSREIARRQFEVRAFTLALQATTDATSAELRYGVDREISCTRLGARYWTLGSQEFPRNPDLMTAVGSADLSTPDVRFWLKRDTG